MSTPMIYQQVPKVMAEIEAVSKTRDNKAQGFKFRGIDDIINEVSARLAKHHLFVVPEVLSESREERATKSGGSMTYVILKIKYTLFAEDGSSVSATMIGEGADTGDKASNKAQSIALKYFFLQVFAIPTEDSKDPDEDSPEFKTKTPNFTADIPDGDYICTFGKFKGSLIKDIDQFQLDNYVRFIIEKAEAEGKPLRGQVLEFIERSEAFLSASEDRGAGNV